MVDDIFLTLGGLPGDRSVMGLVAFDLDFLRWVAGLGKSCHDSKVGGCDAGEVVEIDELDEVIGSVLAGELFVNLDQSNCIEPGVGERRVVTAPTESVAAKDEFGAEFSLGFADDQFGESCKLTGVVGLGFFAKDSNSVGVGLPGLVGGRPDGVVVEDGVDEPLFFGCFFGYVGRAEEALFFAGEGDEVEGVFGG